MIAILLATGRSSRVWASDRSGDLGRSQLAPLQFSALHRPIVGICLFVILGARAAEKEKDRLTILGAHKVLYGLRCCNLEAFISVSKSISLVPTNMRIPPGGIEKEPGGKWLALILSRLSTEASACTAYTPYESRYLISASAAFHALSSTVFIPVPGAGSGPFVHTWIPRRIYGDTPVCASDIRCTFQFSEVRLNNSIWWATCCSSKTPEHTG
jgi:hypothetical protein